MIPRVLTRGPITACIYHLVVPLHHVPPAYLEHTQTHKHTRDPTLPILPQRKVKSVPQWKRKTHIIESINELIEELENIQQSITIQGVEHIHAKEVGPSFGGSHGDCFIGQGGGNIQCRNGWELAERDCIILNS